MKFRRSVKGFPFSFEGGLVAGAVSLVLFSLWLSHRVVSDVQMRFLKPNHELLSTVGSTKNYFPNENEKKHIFDDESIFLPGSIKDMTRTETVNRCYVDPVKYKQHKLGNICTYSPKYDLFYFLIPKSGSSTGRHVMKHSFEADEHSSHNCKRFMETGKAFNSGEGDKTLRTTSLRNPLSRFFASYDEMHVRRLGKLNKIPANYNAWMKDYDGWDYDRYKELFETKEGVQKITRSFEKFVHDWDGVVPFDVHLMLQTPVISDSKGKIYPFDIAFDTHDMGNALKEIAHRVSAPEPEIIRGRSYPRRINTSDVSTETKQKICRLSAIDFCCLNYALPKECLRDDQIPVGERVRCRWVNKPEISDELMIESVMI
mmetsp:Transcript_32372/g.39843  ORF Transcript_32372/g.39843 Transcript_32372/m.39843 type:complete len:372 (-) Transcript_32372:1131-2246(-)